ncbi:hypothetical protein BKA62DRAFT_689909 [Auriculariales sp. MPI-PUGE-AT-0066]|nr:hypothetical protein BKA62DRAFT_689909 [Auriculariales sp. MPI-PUGE-AT-0066]
MLTQDEVPRPTHPRSLSFYVAFVCIVLPLYSLAPLAWLYVAAFTAAAFTTTSPQWIDLSWTSHFLARVALVYACIEVVFSLYHFYIFHLVTNSFLPLIVDIHVLRRCLIRVLQAGLVQTTPETLEQEMDKFEKQSIFEALPFDDPRAVDFRNCLRTWFRGVPFSEIRRADVYAWLYWATYGLPFPGLKALDEVHRAALQDAMQLLEYRVGCEIPEGSNPDARPYLLRLDPISVWARPFVLYALVGLGNLWLRRHLARAYSAREGSFGDMEYIISAPEGWNPSPSSPAPIVFLHGLGVGPLQYASTIKDLLRAVPDRPVLIIRQPSISQDIFHRNHLRPMDKQDMVNTLHGLLESLGWTEHGVTILSHSNGSIPHAWMVKEHPQVIRRSCFVDPVVFTTWEGDVCHNFVYRPPHDAITLLMRYFVGCEVGIAQTIQCRFNWAENTLFFEDIPQGHDPRFARFYLGGMDSIVASARVKRYLMDHGVQDGEGIMWDATGRHGEAILTNSKQIEEVLAWLAADVPHKA